MPENTDAPVAGPSITPSQLPLQEQAELYAYLRDRRQQERPSSWQWLAIATGFAQRTLERFYRGAMELEANADTRPHWVLVEERCGRMIHAELTARPPDRSLFPPGSVAEDLVPPPLRRELTPSQLPLREKAFLFIELREERRQRPSRSWNYLGVLHGFAPRTLEHFYRSATKLESNEYERSLAEIWRDVMRAERAEVPKGRRAAADAAEGFKRRAGERRLARTKAT